MALYKITPRQPSAQKFLSGGGGVGLSGLVNPLKIVGGAFAGPLVAQLPLGVSWDTSIGAPSGTPGNMDLTFPTFSGTTHNCSTVAQVNTAIANSVSGDIINITADLILTASLATFPNKGSNNRILICSSNRASIESARPWSGNYLTSTKSANRIDEVAHASLLRKLTMRANNQSIFNFAPGATGYWFLGLDCVIDQGFVLQGGIFNIAGSTSHTSESDMPSVITIDRCHLHAFSATSHNVRRAVRADGDKVLIAHSILRVGFENGTNSDTQAIHGNSGNKNVLVYNCELQAGTETVMCGGGDVTITNYDNKDWMFIRNHFTKNTAWVNETRGKNVWEAKHIVRWLYWGNVVENYYQGAQGHMIVQNCANQSGNDNWAKVHDTCYWLNKFIGTIEGPMIMNAVGGSGPNNMMGTLRTEFGHNSFPGPQVNSLYRRNQLIPGANISMSDFYVHHNLLCATQMFMYMGDPSGYPPGNSSGFWVCDNINRGVRDSGISPISADGTGDIAAILTAAYGSNHNLRRNWLQDSQTDWGPVYSNSPHNNGVYVNDTDIFTDPVGGDFTVKVGHPAKGSGLGGEDAGPNFDRLNFATSGVNT